MKKHLFFLLTVLIPACLFAQNIHPVVQEQLDLEEIEFLSDELVSETVDEETTVEYSYKGETRDGSVDTIYCYKWNRVEEIWVNHSRSIKVFDENERILERTFQVWTDEGNWKNGMMETFVYNDSGKLVEKTIQVWHRVNEEWINHFRKQFFYNDLTQLSGVLMQHWNRELTDWMNRHHRMFAYGENDLLIADTTKKWFRDAEVWIGVKLNKYVHNDAGKLKMKILLKKRHHHNGPWHHFARELFHYDDNDILTGIKTEIWDNLFDIWVSHHRIVLQYNDEGKLHAKSHQFWFRLINIWVNKNRVLIGYNDEGLVAHRIKQSWNHHQSLWMNRAIEHFQYDGDGSIVEKLLQLWNRQLNDWMNFKKWVIEIQYKSGPADLPDISENGVDVIYQNPYPAYAPITVVGLGNKQAVLDIYDLSGKRVTTIQCKDQSSVTISSDLKQGIYIICLHDNKKILFNDKIVIMN